MKSKAFDPIEGFEFAKNTKKKFFIGKDAGGHFARRFTPREVEVYPGVSSFDPKYLHFTGKLADSLRERFESVVLPSGFYDQSAIPTNFGELRTVSGYPMNPMTYTPVHNHLLRSSLKLADGFLTDRHEKIFRELLSLRYAKHDGTLGKLSKLSSSVFPLFSKSMSVKVSHLNLISQNINDVLDKAASGDLVSLFDRYGMLVAYEAVPRWQYDGVKFDDNGMMKSKSREVNDLEYALSEGMGGNRFTADKTVVIDGSIVKNHFAQRGRTASGMSNSVNSLGTAAFEGLRHYADSTYEATYKHRSRDDIRRKFRKYPLVLGLDVTQYDQSFPEWLVDKWIDLLPFTDNMKALTTLMMKAPMFFASVGPENAPVWTGDPLDASYFNQWKGLPSGIFATSAIGKDMMTWAVLCIFDDYYHNVVGNIDKILKWEFDLYALSNMGDDSVLHIKDKSFYDYLLLKNETSETGLSPYFVIDLELGIRFVGNVAYETSKGEIDVCGDLGTYFGNMIVPERSIGGKMREFGVFGLIERRNAYSDAPKFHEAEEVFLKLWYDTFGFDWRQGLEDALVMPKQVEGMVMSQADIEVLLDPSKLHYKYGEKDVSQNVLAIVEKRIAPEVSDRIIRAAIKV